MKGMMSQNEDEDPDLASAATGPWQGARPVRIPVVRLEGSGWRSSAAIAAEWRSGGVEEGGNRQDRSFKEDGERKKRTPAS